MHCTNTENALLQRLQNKEGQAIYLLYRQNYSSVEKYIILNSGFKEDAEDVFQEGVLILLAKVSEKNFVFSASFKTFLFSICKHLWLKQLRQRSSIRKVQIPETREEDFLTVMEEIEHTERKWNSIPVVLKRVTSHCSALLKDLFLTGKIPDHYKNEHTLHNQKYKCLEQARRVVAKLQTSPG